MNVEKLAKKTLEKGKVEDLVLLDDISEKGICDNLRARFNGDQIYTSIGPVLISMNPFKQVGGLYTPGMIKAYNGAYSYERAPHVYGPAEETYRALLSSGRNQCILVSGESGAGKTEATKKILEYVSAVSGNNHAGISVGAIKDKLLESNPVMEAFGNAKTLRNDSKFVKHQYATAYCQLTQQYTDSSRFGKYMRLQMDYSGAPLGATINTYLLEKPRVVRQQAGERNFHIFYALCAGVSGNLKSELGLDKASAYEYTKTTVQVKSIDDAKDFAEVDSALDILVGGERKKHLYSLVAAVLHLGNITFKPVKDAHDVTGTDIVARSFQVDTKILSKALTYRTIRTRGEAVSTPLKTEDCSSTRDALAKAVYARAFKQLAGWLNESLNTKERVELTMGLLDIFGFEIFERNSFEQLLINYCNEKLQQIFVKLTLESEQKEYTAEGLKWQDIPYFDNAVVCELIDSRKPAGIIAFCDEEAIMPGSNDKSLLNKLNNNLAANNYFGNLNKDARKGDSTEFLVKHYAGDVVYSCDGFIEKNLDTLYRDLIELMGSSRSAHVASLFPESKESHDGKKPVTAGSQFRIDMADLMTTLLACDPHYVRCIKPNDNKQSGVFDEARVAHQVRYLGLLENVRVRRAGFAYRHTYALFVHRYKMTSPAIWLKFPPSGDAKKDARAILDSMSITGEGDQFAMGKTKIFIRRPESLFALEERRDKAMDQVVTMIQKAWHAYKARKYFLQLREKSMGIFKGRKRRRGSWVLLFQADYIGARKSQELKMLFENPKCGGHDNKVVFADRCDVFTGKKKPLLEPKNIVFTDKSIYVADTNWKTARRIELSSVQKFVLSQYADGIIVVKLPESGRDGKKSLEPDLIFNSVRKAEIITLLSEQRGNLPLDFQDQIEFRFLKKSFFSSKIIPGKLSFKEGDTGSAFFTLLPNNPQKIEDLTVTVCAAMGTKATLQLLGSAPERSVATLAGRAAAGFIDHSNKANDLKKTAGPSSPTDFSAPASMTAVSSTAGLKRAKVLYEYTGTNAKDLSIKPGDVVFIVKMHDDGWCDAQIDGKRGMFPFSYAEAL